MEDSGTLPPDSEVEGLADLAAKLNLLFEKTRPAGKPPLSNDAAAEGIRKKYKVSISGSYLWALRNGKKANPTVLHLRAIAKYFGVDPIYLIEEGPHDDIESELGAIAALRDAGVRNLAARAFGLTPRSLESLAKMADHARELDGLPPASSTEVGEGEAAGGGSQ
ncbi:ESX-1 secretion-associated regulator EspR [Mycobacteroides abscessus subsp. abscessus]|uniref:helix-turn-helix domain-containing protein n=1 Tax=Mycobacteroides abscessus TaxID=36809 RepID=UPI0009263ACC|nr:helix-turn-helix domain-containing protein [Mycobacteroides abscessus]SHU72775.1 ESX-1 secretion-associated regulator EspR [Mycobacteroides abscessus subsp. abscessus]